MCVRVCVCECACVDYDVWGEEDEKTIKFSLLFQIICGSERTFSRSERRAEKKRKKRRLASGLFFCVFFTSPSTVPSTQPTKLTKNGLQPPIEDDVILHEIHSFFVRILIHTYSIPSRICISFDTLLDTFLSSLLEMRTPT